MNRSDEAGRQKTGRLEAGRLEVGGQAPAWQQPRLGELAGRTLLVIGLVAATVLVLLLIGYAADVFLLFFASILLAILLRGISDWLAAHTRLSPGWALAITVAVLVVATGLVGWLLGERVASQFGDLGQQLTSGLNQAESFLRRQAWVRRLGLVTGGAGSGPSSGGIIGSLFGLATSSINVVASVLIFLFLGLFLAINPGVYIRGLLHLAPIGQRGRIEELLPELGSTLRWWMIGRLISMVEVGVLTMLALWLCGVPLPLTLGFIAGLFGFVPNYGPVVATALTGLVGLSVSPLVGLYGVLTHLLVGGFDGFIVTPLIQQRTVSLPPALILGAQTLLGVLLGAMGVILATPLAAAAYLIVRKVYVRDILGDQSVESQDES